MPKIFLKRPINTNTLIALAASLASICAVFIAVYQTYMSRQQQLNSVWPYLLTFESMDEAGISSIVVANYGIGPAIIDSVEISYRGNIYGSPTDVVRVISKEFKKNEYAMPWSYTQIRKGYAIPQGHTLEWIKLNTPEDNAIFAKELPNIKMVIYYRSIYDEHWKNTINGEETDELVVKIE
ncbi:hypothetical protein GXP67_34345 [Rhodocytophaga rosea]|uniref:Uncharacterized protein n=1 Tax=Rhodocytophaga rosea TaxID=2704465 RepID=A0A6C0GVR9_9BACT|nr:hypothetical protein [Rhodocytophaga rosea]QHT71380.1 hypothetical protein GXP67_34345 [Rhodocytophaga rosea]